MVYSPANASFWRSLSGATPRHVDRLETGQQLDGVAQRGRRRRVEEGQVVARSPDGQFQRQVGQIGAGDLGRGEGSAPGVLTLGPQPVGDAGAEASGPTGPLIGRGA